MPRDDIVVLLQKANTTYLSTHGRITGFFFIPTPKHQKLIMEETVRALPDAAVQETSFENDVPAQQPGPEDDDEHRQQTTGPEVEDSDEGAAQRRSQDGGVTSKLTTTTKSTARAVAPDLLRGLLVVLMALDHNAVLNAWSHETAIGGEFDSGVPVHRWNSLQPYVIRLLTYLWPPGLMFLFGTGIVYVGRSRKALGWSSWRLLGHFLVRAIILIVITVLLGLALTAGKIWFLNLILFTLAANYLLTGIFWILISNSEESLAFGLLRVLPDSKNDDAREPLLADRGGSIRIAPDRKIIRAADISWHAHNALLLVLTIATIGWNVWLSPTGGHCILEDIVPTLTPNLPRSNWFRIWFLPVETNHVLSVYPPLAWISFAILGLLYGRIVLARTWTRTALTLGNASAGLAFLIVFALTRLLHLGNLSEDCLWMPEHENQPNSINQYLASPRSFFYLTVYPPDVAFWAYGVGLNLLLLSFMDILPIMVASTVLQPLVEFGTSPLFFYVVHLPLLGLSRLFWLKIYGHETGRKSPLTGDDDRGVEKIWVFWLNWALVLVILYPLCRWYAVFKGTRGPDSVWRFF